MMVCSQQFWPFLAPMPCLHLLPASSCWDIWDSGKASCNFGTQLDLGSWGNDFWTLTALTGHEVERNCNLDWAFLSGRSRETDFIMATDSSHVTQGQKYHTTLTCPFTQQETCEPTTSIHCSQSSRAAPLHPAGLTPW